MALPETMQAMVLEGNHQPIIYKHVPLPALNAKQVLVRVIACGVCRTDLHIVDGELNQPKLPLIPGHEIVGTVVKTGNDVKNLRVGDTVGIPWLGYTCGQCRFCLTGRENLCDKALFTGYTLDGGYAQYTVAYEPYCFSLSPRYANPAGAPLLCAGLIGYRSYSMVGAEARNIGIYGFGAAAHILVQVATHQQKNIYAFTRDGDKNARQFALDMGAKWAGDSSSPAPVKLDAAIIFAPVGSLVPKALSDTEKGGVVVCGGIHMSDIPSFPYKLLWEERSVRSVANLTRKDAENFLRIAAEITIHTEIQPFHLQQANEALNSLRTGKIKGAAVLVMD